MVHYPVLVRGRRVGTARWQVGINLSWTSSWYVYITAEFHGVPDAAGRGLLGGMDTKRAAAEDVEAGDEDDDDGKRLLPVLHVASAWEHLHTLHEGAEHHSVERHTRGRASRPTVASSTLVAGRDVANLERKQLSTCGTPGTVGYKPLSAPGDASLVIAKVRIPAYDSWDAEGRLASEAVREGGDDDRTPNFARTTIARNVDGNGKHASSLHWTEWIRPIRLAQLCVASRDGAVTYPGDYVLDRPCDSCQLPVGRLLGDGGTRGAGAEGGLREENPLLLSLVCHHRCCLRCWERPQGDLLCSVRGCGLPVASLHRLADSEYRQIASMEAHNPSGVAAAAASMWQRATAAWRRVFDAKAATPPPPSSVESLDLAFSRLFVSPSRPPFAYVWRHLVRQPMAEGKRRGEVGRCGPGLHYWDTVDEAVTAGAFHDLPPELRHLEMALGLLQCTPLSGDVVCQTVLGYLVDSAAEVRAALAEWPVVRPPPEERCSIGTSDRKERKSALLEEDED